MNAVLHVAVDEEGYLQNPEEWDKLVARELARIENIELNEDYWQILSFIRSYWIEHCVVPDVRHVIRHLADSLGLDKKGAKNHLFKLFPYGYVQQACKIAGMLKPRAWSTG